METLAHPGDAYSYDIFSQAADALRHPKAINPLGGLTFGTMLATGRSSPAFRLVTYINAVHPMTHSFDGYLVHSRGANRIGLQGRGLARTRRTPCRPARTCAPTLDVPVLDLQTEGDMVALRAHLTHQGRSRATGVGRSPVPRTRNAALGRRDPAGARHGPACKDPVNSAPHHAW